MKWYAFCPSELPKAPRTLQKRNLLKKEHGLIRSPAKQETLSKTVDNDALYVIISFDNKTPYQE